jgi:hypothetical protein
MVHFDPYRKTIFELRLGVHFGPINKSSLKIFPFCPVKVNNFLGVMVALDQTYAEYPGLRPVVAICVGVSVMALMLWDNVDTICQILGDVVFLIVFVLVSAFVLLCFLSYSYACSHHPHPIFAFLDVGAMVLGMAILFLSVAANVAPPAVQFAEGLLPTVPGGSIFTVVALVGATISLASLFLSSAIAKVNGPFLSDLFFGLVSFVSDRIGSFSFGRDSLLTISALALHRAWPPVGSYPSLSW